MKKQLNQNIRNEIAEELTNLLEKMVNKYESENIAGEFLLEVTQMGKDLMSRMETDKSVMN